MGLVTHNITDDGFNLNATAGGIYSNCLGTNFVLGGGYIAAGAIGDNTIVGRWSWRCRSINPQ